MKIEQFERLIEASDLTLIHTMAYHLRFIVCLQVGTRFQNDTLAFGSNEFVLMKTEDAQYHIDACKRRLERAAKTQQGVVSYSEPQRQSQPKMPVLATVQAVNYPAH